MSEEKCPFCGSAERIIKTPYIDPITNENKTTFCCKAQSANAQYIKKHYSPFDEDKPTLEEVSKL